MSKPPEARYNIWSVFFDNPGKTYTTTALAEQFGVSRAYVAKTIQALARQPGRIILRRKVGNQTYYQYIRTAPFRPKGE